MKRLTGFAQSTKGHGLVTFVDWNLLYFEMLLPFAFKNSDAFVSLERSTFFFLFRLPCRQHYAQNHLKLSKGLYLHSQLDAFCFIRSEPNLNLSIRACSSLSTLHHNGEGRTADVFRTCSFYPVSPPRGPIDFFFKCSGESQSFLRKK